MTTTTTEVKMLKITMSERRPLSIVEDEWPLIACADWHDGAVQSQANHVRTIRVRQHADGRRLVYGWLRAGNGGVYAGWRGAEGGLLVQPFACVPNDTETVRAIRRVAGIIEDDKLGDQCIADLPAESIGATEDLAGPTLAVPSAKLAVLFALLVQAVPYVPEPLKSEIREALRAGAK
jgi:hypothetical protein